MTSRAGHLTRVATALLLAGLPGLAQTAGEAAPRRTLHVTDDGAGIVDEAARLAWSRCVEGMQWNGRTCAGEAGSMTHAEALAAAAARARIDGLPWRLPRVSEMQHLALGTPPALAPVLFPAAPRGWHWSATAVVDLGGVNQYRYQNIRRHVTEENVNRVAFLQGWAVDLATGEARDDILKRTALPVRLVRSLD